MTTLPTKDFKQLILTLLTVFLVAFIGGVSGWRVAEQGDRQSDEVNTNSILAGQANIADVVERVQGSVVSIDAGSIETTETYFFGTQEYEVVGSGSGIVLSEDGLIVTNKHVVNESTTSISVISSNGEIYEDVEFVGSDPFSDIAYLKVNGSNDFNVATLGDSSKVRVGDEVIAIGNALGVYSHSVTRGIISGLGRPILGSQIEGSEALFNLFQTDASINQGNSGGPLINLNGEVIGINTAVAGSAENIGFAIPINDIISGINSIIETGELQRPYLGVRFLVITPALAESLDIEVDYGALLSGRTGESAILDVSPAEKAGLQDGDIILEVNDKKIDEKNPLTSSINGLSVGDKINLKVLRDGQTLDLELTLEAAPSDL